MTAVVVVAVVVRLETSKCSPLTIDYVAVVVVPGAVSAVVAGSSDAVAFAASR